MLEGCPICDDIWNKTNSLPRQNTVRDLPTKIDRKPYNKNIFQIVKISSQKETFKITHYLDVSLI